MTLQVGLVPIVRPLFRGARMGLQESSRQALAALGADLGFALAYAPDPVGDAAAAQAAAREVAARHATGALDFVLVEHITFATGDLIAPFLALPVPMGIWALPEIATTGPLPQNALCGLNLSLSLPAPRDVPVKWFYGDAADAGFRRRLEVTVRALRGARAVRRARVLWIGGTAPGFTRLESLPDLPVHVERRPLGVVFDAMRAVDDAAVEARLADLTEPSAIRRDDLRGAVRVELALEALAGGYDAVALRCWPEIPDRTGVQTCSAYARLADRGCPFACEGDAAGVISMLGVAAVTGEPAVLLDLSHVDRQGLLFWHCGNAARVWAAGGHTRLAPHFNRGIPAVRDMRLAPGPVSGLRFLEHRRAAVYAGTVLERHDGYDGVSGWIGNLRWAGRPLTPDGFLASALNHRLPHHLVWGRGEDEAALLELCAWLGHEPLVPDPEVATLRWTPDAR
ncbi:MAG: fucose isomerase [Armatimonadota bacterium]|nr:fucose isomerase [Armatimonadota bacterium]